MDGLMGKLLFINLGSGKTEERPLDATIAKNFLGGPGLGAKILFDEMHANTAPFAPESMIGFVAGPLNGTGSLLAGRYTFVSKSPVTNGWNDANSGGFFGPMMKKAGYDAIFINGISQKPVYIFIDDEKVEFRDASALWGKTISDVETAIKKELGDDKVCIAQVGPAGERKSLMSVVMNDGHRAAARGGPGAVMGSKNLKAVVVRGNKTPTVADVETQRKINKEIANWQKDGPVSEIVGGFKELGTTVSYVGSILSGGSSVKNWMGSAVDLTEEEMNEPMTQEKFKKKKYSCSTCPIGCGAIFDVREGDVDIEDTGRPEFETLGMFGSQILNSDPVTINVCNHLCNEYGLDTISVGGTVAWAMECYCDGVLSKEELDGIDLTWGNAEAVVKITEKICKGEGVGEILQEGSRFAANYFGKGHSALVEASGIEIPQRDPRWGPGIARTYQYDPTPGRHVKGGLGPQCGNQPPEVKYNYDNMAEDDVNGLIFQEIVNAGGFCQFSDFGLPPEAHLGLINAVTGFNYSEEDRRKLGLRTFIMRHAFNIREGYRRDDWTLSDRIIGIPPLKEGPTAGVTVDVKKMTDNFFEHIGFTPDSVPLRKTLEDIGGLESVIEAIYSRS